MMPTTKSHGPIPPAPQANNPLSIVTGRGSYFEYAVRNSIRNAFNIPRYHNTSNDISHLEQMIYRYHLSMMHIDMAWIVNWQRLHRTGVPSIFELPSRAARYFYNEDVKYVFGDGRERTLDSHHMECHECHRLFIENVNNVHSHRVNRYFTPNEKMYERRTTRTKPYAEVELENRQRRWNVPQQLPVVSHVEAPAVSYSQASTSSTLDEWKQFKKKYRLE